MSNTPLVIYHRNCNDGFGAAFAAWTSLGDQAEYHAAQYGEITSLDNLPSVQDRDVYILDFSLNVDVMEQLTMTANHVTWLDHHKTAFESMGLHNTQFFYKETSKVTIILDNDKSGALLAWEHFNGTPVPDLIKYVDDYDRWQFKLIGTKNIHSAIRSVPYDFVTWMDWINRGIKALNDLDKEGAAIERYRKEQIEVIVNKSRKCSIRLYVAEVLVEFEGLAANCNPCFTSDAGHGMALESGTYGLTWILGQDTTCYCSLRSNGDYDVSAIAKHFGGGGHRNAAGFSVDINTLLSWM